VIFALTLTVLLGFAGLSIDAIRLYDLYARELRAAEAGALAGVSYMPCYYDQPTSASPCPSGSTSPDANSAVARAMEEVFKNGFGTLPSSPIVASPCPTVVSTVEVAVCVVTGHTTDLRVTITETQEVVLLSALGVGASTISASAQAEFLPPIQLGSRLNYIGDQAECTFGGPAVSCDPRSGGSSHLQNFMANINGPAELKEQGDPFVYCEEANSQAATNTDSDATTGPYYASFNDPAGQYWRTNQPQYADSPHCGVPSFAPLNVGNPDQQPPRFDGPMTQGSLHPGAYNYFIQVPAGSDGATVWIYNTNDIPDDLQPSGVSGALKPLDSFYGPYAHFGPLTYVPSYHDDPSLYFNVTYTLYSAPSLLDRSGDTQIATTTFRPYDMTYNDLVAHGCATDQAHVYNLGDPNTEYHVPSKIDTGGTYCTAISAIAGCYRSWCNISPIGGLAAGTYRLAVEATGYTNPLLGWGGHLYGVKVCGPGVGLSPVDCASGGTLVSSWNNMDVAFSASTSAYLDLAYVPVQYAGRSIIVSLFDPGDSSFNVYMRVVPPPGSGVTVAYPTGIRTGMDDTGNTAIWASNNGDKLYNGLWINVQVDLPSAYPGGWWQVYYSTAGGTPHDKLAVQFSLVGSPVHLVPAG
jgi:hypothetical protein